MDASHHPLTFGTSSTPHTSPTPHTSSTKRFRLLLAEADDDGGHSGTRLSAQTAAGRTVRLRRGVYLPLADWLTAAPWERHEIAVAAGAVRDPGRIFCRQSALALHGVPLVASPGAVTQRTSHRGDVGLRRGPAFLGGITGRRRLQLMQRWSVELGRSLRDEDLLPVPLRRHEPVVPRGATREQLRAIRTPTTTLEPATVRLGAHALSSIDGPAQGYRVEPLGLALADTLPRMPFADAVAAADAVVAGRRTSSVLTVDELLEWLPWIRSRRAQARFRHVLDFADPRSESPGESLSRVVMGDLGFEAPDLQVVVDTDGGRRFADFGWRGGRIIGEFDGRTKYVDSRRLSGEDPATVIWKEKRRQESLERAGRTVARWGWYELRHPRLLEQTLLAKGVPRLTS